MLLVLGRWPGYDYTVFARKEFDLGQEGRSFSSKAKSARASTGSMLAVRCMGQYTDARIPDRPSENDAKGGRCRVGLMRKPGGLIEEVSDGIYGSLPYGVSLGQPSLDSSEKSTIRYTTGEGCS